MAKRQKLELDLGSFCDTNGEKSGDNNGAAPCPPDPYLWRRDPASSQSDWKIVVTVKPETEPGIPEEDADHDLEFVSVSTTYHVHRLIIASGPRGSSYFLQLFNSSQEMAEFKTSTSHIELEKAAAEAFPNMLDFIYAMHTTDVVASTDTAVALRNLAKYFGIPTLFENLNSFIQKDMNWENIHKYLEPAQLFHDEKIIEATMTIAADAWPHVLLEEDGKSAKESAYMNLLPESQRLRVWKLAMFQATSELRGFRRLSGNVGRFRGGIVEPSEMPLFGNQESHGLVDGDHRPLFFFQR